MPEYTLEAPSLFDHVTHLPAELALRRAERLAGEFIAGYSRPRTREALSLDLRTFFAFLVELGDPDPLDARRGHFDVWARSMEDRGLMPATVNRRLGTACTFFKWLTAEEHIVRNPTLNVRRPKVPRTSSTEWMGRQQLILWLEGAEEEGGYVAALGSLLALNALRISEALNADISDLGSDSYHHTLAIVGKGNIPDVIGLHPRCRHAIALAIGDRTSGPLILNQWGLRMKRANAALICDRLSAKAAPGKRITPHSIRHSSITAFLNATDGDITGAQRLARHADIGTTTRYDRRRHGLRDSPSYVVAHYLAGGD